MMNLYQQQQLQQQQQQLHQQTDITGADPQMAALLQQHSGQTGLDPMFGAAQLQQHRASLGLGGSQLGGGFGGQQAQLPSMMGATASTLQRDPQQQLLQNSNLSSVSQTLLDPAKSMGTEADTDRKRGAEEEDSDIQDTKRAKTVEQSTEESKG